jgi:hypothetical protein
MAPPAHADRRRERAGYQRTRGVKVMIAPAPYWQVADSAV